MSTDDAPRVAKLEALNRAFAAHIPFNNALGIALVSLGDAHATQRLPPDPRWIGDLDTGTIHGGVITTLLDSCCGAAVFMALEKPVFMATLDLRVDFLQPSDATKELQGRADCYRLNRQVGFVRCSAWQDDPNDPVAVGTATFAIGTPHGLPGARKLS
ncbi:MAG: hypothetical protein ACI8RZ_007047 [Myxococcota bacterium]|jgi:uncharacterized protein (TIGR00369 family)